MLRTLINQRLGRYTITALLGRGGMAAVYRASDSVLQRDVALKILHPQYSDDQTLVQRFMHEAVTAAALDHPHIVPVYDVGEQDGMAYIAMKLLSGETLQERLQRVGRLGPDELCAILRPVADALDYAHSRGVVHRDIKPGNIFLGQAALGPPQVMLTDFGIAKRLDNPGLTTTGSLIGTPDYMAPEQIAGRPVDARTDVYALGMLAYRALTGRRAFEGGVQDVLMGHLYQVPPPPSSLNPQLSPALDKVVLQAVASSPADRFPSAGAFVRALAGAMDATPVGTLPPPVRPTNGGQTTQNPAVRVALPQSAPAQSSPYRPAVTHTTIGGADRQASAAAGRGSAVPWVVAVVLALLAGGLAVALGILVGERQGGTFAGGTDPTAGSAVGAAQSPTPSVTAVPTLAATSTPAPTEAAGGAASPLPVPSPSATAPPPSSTPLPPPSSTPLPPPTATSEPSATATATPTASPEPTATETLTPTADCTTGLLQGGFGRLYETNVAVRTRLGCPQAGEQAGRGSIQFFDAGTMFYWGLNQTELRDTIVVFYGLDRGDYAIVEADEAASYPEAAPNDDPNAPVRGFGRVYYGKAGVAEALGSWTSPEIELNGNQRAVIQFFSDGVMLFTPVYRQSEAAAIFVLYADGTFERYNDQPAR